MEYHDKGERRNCVSILRYLILGLAFAVSFWSWNNDTHGDLSRRLRAKCIDTYSSCLCG